MVSYGIEIKIRSIDLSVDTIKLIILDGTSFENGTSKNRR